MDNVIIYVIVIISLFSNMSCKISYIGIRPIRALKNPKRTRKKFKFISYFPRSPQSIILDTYTGALTIHM